jgi:hypothetical protein
MGIGNLLIDYCLIISQRPSGEIIAAVQQLPHRHDIIFFERNGLRHYEFQLRDNCQVISLHWNSSSELLSALVHIETTEGESIKVRYLPKHHTFLFQSRRIICVIWFIFHACTLYNFFINFFFYYIHVETISCSDLDKEQLPLVPQAGIAFRHGRLGPGSARSTVGLGESHRLGRRSPPGPGGVLLLLLGH